VFALRRIDLKMERAAVFTKALNFLAFRSLCGSLDGFPRSTLVMGDHGTDMFLNLISSNRTSHLVDVSVGGCLLFVHASRFLDVGFSFFFGVFSNNLFLREISVFNFRSVVFRHRGVLTNFKLAGMSFRFNHVRSLFAVWCVDISDESSVERVDLLKVYLTSLDYVLKTESEINSCLIRNV
jgi:hypothetical protein